MKRKKNWNPFQKSHGHKKDLPLFAFSSAYLIHLSPAIEPVNYVYLQKEGNKNNVVSTC